MDEIEQRVLQCLTSVFPDIEQHELKTLSQATHAAAWDSVAHVTIIAALGEAFEVDFDFEAFVGATSFELVVAEVAKQLVKTDR